MKKVYIPIVLSVTFSVIFAQERNPQIAPLDSEFINYIEMVKRVR